MSTPTEPAPPAPTNVGANQTVLFSRGNFDLMSSYLAAYSQKLVDFATKNGYTVVNVYNDDPTLPDNAATFEPQLLKKPNLLIGACHGNSTLFVGQNMEVLIQDGVNEDDLNGIPTFLWACETAQKLGPDAVAKGCPLFLGYGADWTMIYNDASTGDPLSDPYAVAFFDSALVTGYSLLLGQTPQQIFQATVDRYNYWIEYWKTQNDPMTDDILTWLNWDLTNFIAITSTGIQEEKAPAASTLGGIPIIVPVLGVGALLLYLVSR